MISENVIEVVLIVASALVAFHFVMKILLED